jgi:hypothetical protein
LQLNPPNYKRVAELAVEWGTKSRESPKQLFIGLKSAYHIDDVALASDFASKLVRYSKDELLNNALAAAIISDLNDTTTGITFTSHYNSQKKGLKLAQSCSGKEEEFDDDDLFGLLKMTILLSWVDIKSGKSERGVEVLKNLINQVSDSEDWPIGLAFSLLILNEMENGSLEQAENYLQKSEHKKLSNDEHIVAVKNLLNFKKNSTFSKNEVSQTIPMVNPLLRKRLEKLLQN